jgi:DNA-binding Lrp family transcriptional regulator
MAAASVQLEQVKYVAIIDLLIEDGTMSCAGIARSLGSLSTRRVSRRIDALVKDGMNKVTVVPRRTALGYPIIAGIGVETETGKKREVAEILAGWMKWPTSESSRETAMWAFGSSPRPPI